MSYIMKTLKKLLKLIFNRIFYIVFALLIQLGWLFFVVWRLAAYSKYISFGITAISIASVLWILNKKINPSYKLGWTMLILVFPVFGLLLYILFGKVTVLPRKFRTHYAEIQEESLPYMEQDALKFQRSGCTERRFVSSCTVCLYPNTIPVFRFTEIPPPEYFQVGDDMFPVAGTQNLEQAQSLHLHRIFHH